MSLHTRITKLGLAGALALGLSLGGAGAAVAHTGVKTSDPKAGSTVGKSLSGVSVTFTGRILGGTLKVTGPRSRVVSVGRGGRDPRNTSRLTVGLKSGLAAGGYTVAWAMTASDGHPQSGSFRFTVRR